MPDLTSVTGILKVLADLQHSAKFVALIGLAFYIVADAFFTMYQERKYFDAGYAINYITKFSREYLGLVVLAVAGQYVPAADVLFWSSTALYSKLELDGLLRKIGVVQSTVPTAFASDYSASKPEPPAAPAPVA